MVYVKQLKKFTVVLFSAISIVLSIGSIQSISADHLLFDGEGIFKDGEDSVNLDLTRDSKFQLHIQVMVRNGQGQLISATEGTYGYYIPHEMTDYFFDKTLCSNTNTACKKENITIDKTEYKKVERISTQIVGDSYHTGLSRSWVLSFCSEFIEHGQLCVPTFQVYLPHVFLVEDDVVTIKWTILRAMN